MAARAGCDPVEQANDLPPTPSFFHTSLCALCVKMPHGKPDRDFLKALHGYSAFRVFRSFPTYLAQPHRPTFGFEYPVDLHYTSPQLPSVRLGLRIRLPRCALQLQCLQRKPEAEHHFSQGHSSLVTPALGFRQSFLSLSIHHSSFITSPF